jgi:hypothetical protein
MAPVDVAIMAAGGLGSPQGHADAAARRDAPAIRSPAKTRAPGPEPKTSRWITSAPIDDGPKLF